MRYRSQVELNEGCKGLAREVCNTYDLVVGIPRSGIQPASLLSLYLDLPLSDVEGLTERRIMQTGKRYDGNVDFEEIRRVLVVDDSVNSGRQMRETKARIEKMDLADIDVDYAAVFVTPTGMKFVDYWWEVVDMPRVFEWNILHHPKLRNFCVDIDGVLCRDPFPEENDDGARYRSFLETVDPEYVPTKRIGWLVTCRLEKYREETEAWLQKHGIEYDHLVMMDLPDKQTRHELGNRSEYKATVYEDTGAELFIESSAKQATEIARLTGQLVYCIETNGMVDATTEYTKVPTETYYSVGQRIAHYLGRFSRNPVGFAHLAMQYLTTTVRSRFALFADELD
ncbi:phosphoribosyltransferase family protein [Halogranum rubrum]|uniref:Phosphoribosyl transferase n=1 Tax=Halogranum salarium B-1 TaxID=1210908 RepID=J3JET2_9EURY|nr:phosphoribosyltransferase family protein [Halogranum salarium]EJN58634.1 phosphoribosyl transferase [Halogranum salarium B-1]